MDAVKKEYTELKTLNVMVLGKTGVGKSTLINNLFTKKVAETGTGKPVTKQIRKYELPDYPLAIFDTPGLELSGDNDVDNLIKLIPGVNLIGSAISGATAAALTAALGEAYIIILEKVYEGEMTIEDLQTEVGKNEITKVFKERLSLKRDKDGKTKE